MKAQPPGRPYPPDLFPYEFQWLDSTDHGYYAFTPVQIQLGGGMPGFSQPSCLVLDGTGHVAWYWRDPGYRNFADFKYDPGSNRYQVISTTTGGEVRFVLMDDEWNISTELQNVAPSHPDAHDFQVLSDGHYMITGEVDSVFDLSAFQFNGQNGDGTDTVICFTLQKVDDANNLLWQWNSCDHIFPTEFIDGFPYNPHRFDYCHGNAVEEDTDGNYLVSMRHTNAIYKINANSGAIIWTLGGKSSTFSFVNDPGFSGQHDIRRLPNGNYSLFDNSNSAPMPRETRAVQYDLNTTTQEATREYEYKPMPNFFALAMGGYQVLDSFHLVNYGFVYRPRPSAELVGGSGQVLSRLILPDSVMSYRGQLFRPGAGIPRPEVTCAEVGGQIQLQGPPGASSYLWSTGDVSQSIWVNPGDVVQLYVPRGVGRAASFPIRVPTGGGCPLVDRPEPQAARPRPAELVGRYDLLGRPLLQPVPGQVYWERYGDGSTRKRVHFR